MIGGCVCVRNTAASRLGRDTESARCDTDASMRKKRKGGRMVDTEQLTFRLDSDSNKY